MKYKTENALRKKVEKEYGRPLADNTWELSMEILESERESMPPYDDYDVHFILEGIADYRPKQLKKKNVVKAILKSVKEAGEPFHPALTNRSKIQYYRKYTLGLEKPVPIDKVKTTLKELGEPIEEGKAGYFVPYPHMLYSVNIDNSFSIDVCEVGIVAVSAEWSNKVRFMGLVVDLGIMFDCHPALIVAFILCDIVPKSYSMPMIIREGRKLSIVVPNPEVSQRTVSKAYTAAKEVVLREEREICGERARPRAQTEKVSKLLTFVQNNSDLGWKEVFSRWNAENPEWMYDTVHSMQVTYYRAKKFRR